MRWFVLSSIFLLVGCSPTRTVTISTQPPDAHLRIDGRDVGRGPRIETFSFGGGGDFHEIVANRPGYQTQRVQIASDFQKDLLVIELKPMSRVVTINVTPGPAIVKVDGKPISPQPVSQVRQEMTFTIDSRTGQWSTHRVTAERADYAPVEKQVSWSDPTNEYTLDMTPVTRTLTIHTNPPGAEISVGGKSFGPSPVTYPENGPPAERLVKAIKPGYAEATLTIPAEDNRREYTVELAPLEKLVRIATEPAGADVAVKGVDMQRAPDGVPTARLVFTPINEKGDLPTFEGEARMAGEAADYLPQKFSIGWDEGKTDYTVRLAESTTRTTPLVRLKPTQADGAWRLVSERVDLTASKDTSDSINNDALRQITRLPQGTMIDTLAMSPDGSQLLFTMLSDRQPEAPTSAIFSLRTDAPTEIRALTDGQRLDVTPSFLPDGARVVYASNVGDRGMSLFVRSARPGGMAKPLAADPAALDAWASVDASPQSRVFFQSHLSGRMESGLFVVDLAGGVRTDLKAPRCTQPRVSPRADAVVFAAVDPATGKRDLFRVSDKGTDLINLTRTPNVDECDPSWSPDGRRIVYAAEAPAAGGTKNFDIFEMDVNDPAQPKRATANSSCDDRPVFDVIGRTIYFRSNRGGTWQIWRTAAP